MTFHSEEPGGDLGLIDARAAWSWLAVCGVAAGLFNLAIVPLTASARGDTFVFVATAFGVFPGQIGVLALWLVWGPGKLLWRLLLHWLVGLGLFLAVATGALAIAGTRDVLDEAATGLGVVLLSLPLVSLAAQLPMWPLRIYLRWRVADPTIKASALKSQALSIRDILLGTGVTAVALAGIRLVSSLGGAAEASFWIGWAISSLGMVFASLLALLPALWIFLRMGKTAAAVWMWIAYAGLVWVVVSAFFGSGMPGQAIGGFLCMIASFAITVAIPLLIVRAAGWRLILPRDLRKSAGDSPPP